MTAIGNEWMEMEWQTRCPLVDLQGVPLLEPIATHWERVETFQAFPGDLLIATNPKAGTTWIQEIMDLILNHADIEKCKRAPTHVRKLFLEMTPPNPALSGVTQLEKMDPPCVIKTHLPIQLIPKSFWEAGCKVILYIWPVIPRTVWSPTFIFDRMNLVQPEPGPWPLYLDSFMKGKLGWGSWYDHVKGYWRERGKETILYLLFEDMKEDPAREVTRMAEFLGKQLSTGVIDDIVQMTTFAAMRENPMANYSSVPDTIFNRQASEFMRKAEVGDWQNHFSPQEDAVVEEHYHKRMADTPIPFRFKNLEDILKSAVFILHSRTEESIPDFFLT